MKVLMRLSGGLSFLCLLIIFILPGAAGCRQAVDLQAPPEINIGQDICDECGMLIGEARFAAAYWTVDGQPRRFDDIGGMLAYHHEHEEEVATFWVHDYVTEEWMPADEATFLIDDGLQTPMGFGIIAFADADEARAHRTEDGAPLLSFAQLIERAASEALDAPGQHMHAADE